MPQSLGPTGSGNRDEPPTCAPPSFHSPHRLHVTPPTGAIALASDRESNLEIYILHLDTAAVHRLTNSDAVKIGPAWSADGTRIAFSSNYDGDHEICVMNDDGSGLVQLTDNGVDDVNPFWSPDGRYLAFSHEDSENANIFITGAERPLLLRLSDYTAPISAAAGPDRQMAPSSTTVPSARPAVPTLRPKTDLCSSTLPTSRAVKPQEGCTAG